MSRGPAAHRCPWPRRSPADAGENGGADEGFTLVELVVVLMLTALLMGLLAPLLGAAGAATATAHNAQLATAAGTNAVERIETQVSSASAVCLPQLTGGTPVVGSCGRGTPQAASGAALQVVTTAFSPTAARDEQWWIASGQLREQQWPDSGGTPAVSIVAGDSQCSVSAGSGGLFSVAPSASGTVLATISISVTCGSGSDASTQQLSTTTAALNTAATST